MEIVVQLVKHLAERQPVTATPGVRLRNFDESRDIEHWLELRHRAFGRLSVGVRAWSAHDFHQEFSSKDWWRPDRMWLAETVSRSGTAELIGSVTLAKRAGGLDAKSPQAKPVVHWLAVLPSWRRRGVATMLMAALENAALEDGFTEVWLETHSAWTAAAAFYEKLGYERAR